MSKLAKLKALVFFSIIQAICIPIFPSPPPFAPPPTYTPTPTPLPPETPTPTLPPTPTFTPVVVSPIPTPAPGVKCSSAVEGLVQDAETGIPLQGIVVELKGNGWKSRTATGTDGLFRFYGLCYGVGELSLEGMRVVEGDTKVFLDGESVIKVILKAKRSEPVQTPTPAKVQRLPRTGNAWWIAVAGLALGVLAVAINRLRHLGRRSSL